ncbi:23747_t:CDS:1, partial [Gigaspora margarita]
NNIYDDDSLTWINLILEETVNLKDLIFQDEDFVLYEYSTNTTSATSDTNNESDTNKGFDPESLVNTILDELAN